MKPLSEYFDYQEYLRDFYQHGKRDNPAVSYRFLGEKLGLDPGFVLKVMQGKLHLADRSIPRCCEFLKLNERESSYFEALVLYNKSKAPGDIKRRFEQLLLLRGSRAKPIQQWQYAFYQKWYHSAIHALLSIHSYKGDPRGLAALLDPPITARQARESILLLVKLGMVRRTAERVYEPVDAFVTSGEKWHSAAVADFQRETIRLSAEALDRHPRDRRDISTVTVALSAKDLPEIRERIRQLRQSILTLDNENQPDTVYQINIQLIPVTSTLGGDR
jgi:uncharacterized protein (TIGR02147 family)